MELKNIKEFIKTAKAQSPTDEFRVLIDDFESLTELSLATEDTREHKEKLAQAQSKFWSALENILPSFGLTPDLLDAYLENPDNFTPEQWETYQALKNTPNRGN